jgi:hypothetical protein
MHCPALAQPIGRCGGVRLLRGTDSFSFARALTQPRLQPPMPHRARAHRLHQRPRIAHHRHRRACPRDRGIECLARARQLPRAGHDDGDVVELAALGFVDGAGEGGFDVAQPCDGPLDDVAAVAGEGRAPGFVAVGRQRDAHVAVAQAQAAVVAGDHDGAAGVPAACGVDGGGG